jgi:hypothetical protein
MQEIDRTRVLGWPGYKASRHESGAMDLGAAQAGTAPDGRSTRSFMGKKKKLITVANNLNAIYQQTSGSG